MLKNIKNHFIEFLILVLILGGVLYSATESYKTSIKVNEAIKLIKKNKDKIKEINENLAIKKLKNGTLSEDDIKALISSKNIEEFKFKINALEKKP